MRRHSHVLAAGGLTLVLAALQMVTWAAGQPVMAQPVPVPSGCTGESDKSADPVLLALGGEVTVSLALTATCGAEPMAIDLVILADESNSMTEGRSGPPGPTERIDPRTATSTGEPPVVPTMPGGEPSFCPGVPQITPPTATRRPFQRTPTPGPPEATEVPEQPGSQNLIRESQQWIRDFLTRPEIERDFDSGRLRVGFVSFNSRSVVRQPLTDNASSIISAASRMRGSDITRINTGMGEAERVMNGAGRRPEADRTKVIVVLSDFQVCQRDISGGGARRDGTKVVTIGMGREYNQRKANDLATEREYALTQRDLPNLVRIYERELTASRGLAVAAVTVFDELADNMEYVPDSAQPPPTSFDGRRLEWLLDTPLFPLGFSYSVVPREPGRHPISVDAQAEWTDTASGVGSLAFPPVEVEVIPPTATPTPTPEATATRTPTNTPTPAAAYLPVLYNRWPEPKPPECEPAQQVLDVVLVLDTSTSMGDPTHTGGRPKIDLAIEAATAFVHLIKPVDQASVVGFNAAATVASRLTVDKTALAAALVGLKDTQATGTRIDLGLEAGLAELLATTRTPDTRSIILLTDGRHTGEEGTDTVRAAAAAAKAAGTWLVTVGLGNAEDIDEDLLREVASNPALYFPVPDASDLLRIYQEIVDVIPCP